MFKVRQIGLIIPFLLVASALPGWSNEATPWKDLPPCVIVSGEGKVSARPNMAEINVGVITDSKNAADALKKNNDSMTELIKTLAGKGVPDKDVRTVSFSVNPQYKYDNQPRMTGGRPTIVGYTVNNQVHVHIRDLSVLGGILDALVDSGANSVNGISFSIADPQPILDQARQKAVADARRKAELYAQAAGSKLGRVLYITESGGMVQPPRPMMMGAMNGGAMAVPIATGDQESSVSVTITYALE